VVGPEHEQGAGRRLERAGQQQPSLAMGGVDEREVSLTIRLPALGEVVGGLVKKREVRHTPYDSRMIARMWSGRARSEHADAYVTHLQQKTFPQLASIPGHRGAYILRRAPA